jgi:quinolinate synthase
MTMTQTELAGAIRARKAELAGQLVILGHHYQQDEVIQFADFTGDSFRLSQLAAERVREVGAKYVIFAGVHFMAESADILAPEGTAVILPDLSAGCSMADMAYYDETALAWGEIERALAGTRTRVIPICYMNSTAAIKAFCGEHGGAVCTSSNCQKVFRWALDGGATPLEPGVKVKVLFLPDQHLGRNSAAAMGFDPQTDMCLWNPRAESDLGGNAPADLRRVTFILWQGHCSVHKLFRRRARGPGPGPVAGCDRHGSPRVCPRGGAEGR